ncbi:MAG: hypothetical protein JZD41_09495 [Thermoproteus sp.]|nr:hypothetical protein [Thermoproteus sp.]
MDFATAKANFRASGALTACELRNDGIVYNEYAGAYVLRFQSYIVGTNAPFCPVDWFFDFSTYSTARPTLPGQYKACVVLPYPFGLGAALACDTLTVK